MTLKELNLFKGRWNTDFAYTLIFQLHYCFTTVQNKYDFWFFLDQKWRRTFV